MTMVQQGITTVCPWFCAKEILTSFIIKVCIGYFYYYYCKGLRDAFRISVVIILFVG